MSPNATELSAEIVTLMTELNRIAEEANTPKLKPVYFRLNAAWHKLYEALDALERV